MNRKQRKIKLKEARLRQKLIREAREGLEERRIIRYEKSVRATEPGGPDLYERLKQPILAAGVASASALSGGCANLGYNAVEVGAETTGAPRIRALNNIDTKTGFSVGYHGLNEGNPKTGVYFGNHNLTAGKGLVRFLTDETGVIDNKLGVRIPNALKRLGATYSHLDILANEEGANVTGFFGKVVGKGKTVELYHSQNFPYSGKPTGYSEMQATCSINPHLAATVRAQVPNYNAKKATWFVGITCKK